MSVLSAMRERESRRILRDAIGSQHQQFQLGRARPAGTPIRQIDDLALSRTVDGAVRLLNETGERSRMPVVAPGLALGAIHALLHNSPVAVIGHEEAVQIELKPVLDGRAIHLGHKPAGACEPGRIKASTVSDPRKLFRGAPRMFAASAAYMDPELFFERRKATLQGPDHAGGDPGGMPIHPHHRAERLKPEGMREAP